ncbi:MAG TPA: hypothetical protein VKR61_02680, partial [Bryobacteraceae bacterium]|nr:hypothetical protein [Bryobacteraceae bacterium]
RAFGDDGQPHTRQTWEAQQAANAKNNPRTSTPQILYHGGPIMLGTNTLYIIYYGNFPGGDYSTPAVVNGFFASVGGSTNYNVNTTYYNSQNQHITNSLAFSASSNTYYDNYSIGTDIGRDGIERIVQNAINGSYLPQSTTAIYSVVTSPDVTGSELKGLCAFHAAMSLNGKVLIYAALPDFSGSALSSCSGNIAIYHDTTSPNNNVGADMVLDSFMHELSESVTDPLGNAWWGPKGEVGDICNFNYGTTYIAPNGTHANTHLGTRDYLVQTIWENTGAGFCANSL